MWKVKGSHGFVSKEENRRNINCACTVHQFFTHRLIANCGVNLQIVLELHYGMVAQVMASTCIDLEEQNQPKPSPCLRSIYICFIKITLGLHLTVAISFARF